MKEFKAIVSAAAGMDLSVRRTALATVVKVHGSSYRSPGARMLISDDGRWVGSISGGCLEGDALRKARKVMADGQPMTVTYDTREESNQNLGIGLGCNGVIDVLIEPIQPENESNPLRLFEKILALNRPLALATICRGTGTGQKLLLSEEGTVMNSIHADLLRQAVSNDLHPLFTNGTSQTKAYGSEEVFLELVQPNVSLIIFGGGFDARPVSALAKSIGWDVSVTDECVSHIAPIFFPTADKLSLCQREFVDRDFPITPYTACVLMSHNYEYDRDVLKKLIRSSTPYIGMLGPRKRFDKMLAEFSREGLELSADDLQRIHSPIGLDIGAEAPDEIAVSIIGEIMGKFNGRAGSFLKFRNAPIHERAGGTDQVFKQAQLGMSAARKAAQ